MKKINNYKGSIAQDVDFLQRGNIKPFITGILGCGAVAACSLIPETAPALLSGAAYVVSGITAMGGLGVTLFNDVVNKPLARKRVHKLLNSLNVGKDVNEYDIDVIYDVPMEIHNLKTNDEVAGNYVIVNDGNKKSIVREYTAEDYEEYIKYVMDLTKPQEKELVNSELKEAGIKLVLK